MDLLKIQPNIVSRGVAGKYFLFYGDPSTRKTTVASQFPQALLLATEIGYSMIPGIHAAPIKSWNEFREVVRELKRPEVQEAYKTIVIDTVGLLTDMCMQYIINKNGIEKLGDLPWGEGWTQFKKEFRTQMNTITQLGYGVVFIAHSSTKRDNETGTITSATPMLDKQPRESVIALVDFILFLQKEVKDGNPEEVTVYAYSKLQSTIESKTRARYLSPRFEFNFENLEKEIINAIDEQEKHEQGSTTAAVVNHYVEVAKQGPSFEELKAEVLAIAGPLVNSSEPDIKAQVSSQISAIMKGTPVSQAVAADYDKLATLKETLLEIKEGN